MNKFFLGFVLTFLIDQLTKLLVVNRGLPAFINTGISFGFGEDMSIVFIAIIVVVSAVLIARMMNNFWKENPFMAGAFFAAAASNFVDRLRLGGVVDWLPMPLIGGHNNFADLVLGLVLLTMILKSIKQIMIKNQEKNVS